MHRYWYHHITGAQKIPVKALFFDGQPAKRRPRGDAFSAAGSCADQDRCQAIQDVADRGAADNSPGVSVDGNDPLAVYEAAQEAVARARAGKGPTLVECKTYRQHGHFEGDPAIYKPKEEQAAWMEKDPMPRYAKFLVENGVMTQEEVDAVDAQVAKEIEDAIAFADAQPIPAVETAVVDVYSDIVEEVRDR